MADLGFFSFFNKRKHRQQEGLFKLLALRPGEQMSSLEQARRNFNDMYIDQYLSGKLTASSTFCVCSAPNSNPWIFAVVNTNDPDATAEPGVFKAVEVSLQNMLGKIVAQIDQQQFERIVALTRLEVTGLSSNEQLELKILTPAIIAHVYSAERELSQNYPNYWRSRNYSVFICDRSGWEVIPIRPGDRIED